MPVELLRPVQTGEPDLEVVQLFCLSGLSLSLYFVHLLPHTMVDAMMLLACAG
jgi:hypothetical protein